MDFLENLKIFPRTSGGNVSIVQRVVVMAISVPLLYWVLSSAPVIAVHSYTYWISEQNDEKIISGMATIQSYQEQITNAQQTKPLGASATIDAANEQLAIQ